MPRLQGLLLFFALFVAVFGAVTPFNPTQCAAQAKAGNIKRVNHAFAFPKELCSWYISAKRGMSPISTLSATDFTHACECIVGQTASTTAVSNNPPANFELECAPKHHLRIQGIVKKQPKQFCKFWGNGGAGKYRLSSPFKAQGLSAKEIYDGCYCYGHPVASPTNTEEPTATATATETGTMTGTETAMPTMTGTMTGTETATATAAPTGTETAGPTETATGTETAGPTETATETHGTETAGPTETATHTATETATHTATETATGTETGSTATATA